MINPQPKTPYQSIIGLMNKDSLNEVAQNKLEQSQKALKVLDNVIHLGYALTAVIAFYWL